MELKQTIFVIILVVITSYLVGIVLHELTHLAFADEVTEVCFLGYSIRDKEDIGQSIFGWVFAESFYGIGAKELWPNIIGIIGTLIPCAIYIKLFLRDK